MTELSNRERRLVALLILIALVAFVFVAVIAPYRDAFAERALERDRLTQQLNSGQRLIAATPTLRRRAEVQRAELRRFVLSAPNRERAAVMLQDRTQSAVDALGGELRTLNERPAPADMVGVRLSARLTLDQLTRLLALVQNQQPYLIVDALTISADEALINGKLNPLDVTLELSVPFAPAT